MSEYSDNGALVLRAQQGDEDAFAQLISENAGLIWSIARRYFGRGCDAEDLYQLGCVGFIKAVRGYDTSFGTQFSTYAVPKIAGEIRRFLREHTPAYINDIIRTARENGFLVAYNHPTWSREDPRDYLNYEGLFAMEIYNHGSNSVGFFEYDIQAYDLMLRAGKRIYCSMTDDNHNKNPHGVYTDSFGGFDMIKAPALTYDAVIRALENGDFYASQGPEIQELYLEDGVVHVKCSPAKYISYAAGVRRNAARFGYDGYLEEASFAVDPGDVYFRISVVDDRGRHADTRAYFLDTL